MLTALRLNIGRIRRMQQGRLASLRPALVSCSYFLGLIPVIVVRWPATIFVVKAVRTTVVRVTMHPFVMLPVSAAVPVAVSVPADRDVHVDGDQVRLCVTGRVPIGRIVRECTAGAEQRAAGGKGDKDRTNFVV